MISHHRQTLPVFPSISCHCTKIMWLPGVSTEQWFSWGFNFRNIFVSMYPYTGQMDNVYRTFLPLQFILQRITKICFKVPSLNSLTCTNLLWLSFPVVVPVVQVGSITFPFFGLTVISVGSDLIFTALQFCDPAIWQPAVDARLGCCVGICHQRNLLAVNL